MSIEVARTAPFEWVMEFGITGLEGTVAYKIDSGLDVTVTGPITAGIMELGTVGTYVAAVAAAPGTAGMYVLLGSYDGTFDPDTTFAEQLIVTDAETAAIGGTSNLYVSSAELKEILSLSGETFADAAIALAVSAASRTCDAYKKKTGTGFYPTAATRYYSPGIYDPDVTIHDLTSLTAVTVDRDTDGTYSETWVNETDFWLEPTNAAADGRPYNRLVLRQQAGRRFPSYQRNLKIVGSFGWSACPIQVKEATILLANDLLYRMREAPLGVLIAAGAEAVAMARLGRINAAAAMMLDLVDPSPEARSIQLR